MTRAVPAVLLMAAAACGGRSPGESPCGSRICAPGQYCADEARSTCQTGCLSEANCGDESICFRRIPTEVGTCHACIGELCP